MHASMGAGLGLKAEHLAQAIDAVAPGLWFEVPPENYMVDGGPRLETLDTVASRHPLSLHGVSLSLAADAPPDAAHLARLRRLIDRVRPALVSEHLAWSYWRGRYAPDLLPFPRSHAALARIADNIARTQDALGRAISIENPSHYLQLDGHDFDEPNFFGELVARTGCGLLLDLNNVFVSSHNLGVDPWDYLDAFPLRAVTEIHLAGHAPDPLLGGSLLIDSHDAPVADEVWNLYRTVRPRLPTIPVLIERDGNVPPFETLLAERAMAERVRVDARQAA
jgi:uncharacterized protein (UPF0276 family)